MNNNLFTGSAGAPARNFFKLVHVEKECGRGRPRSQWLAFSFSLDCIEKQRIGCPRLTAVLRAKAEENDAAFAHADFDQRGFAFDAIAAE